MRPALWRGPRSLEWCRAWKAIHWYSVNGLLKGRNSPSDGNQLRANHSPCASLCPTAPILYPEWTPHQELCWMLSNWKNGKHKSRRGKTLDFYCLSLYFRRCPGCDCKVKWTNPILIAMTDDNLLQGIYSLIRVQHGAWNIASQEAHNCYNFKHTSKNKQWWIKPCIQACFLYQWSLL